MIVFDGYQLASELESQLKIKVSDLKNKGKHIKIAALLFVEDRGSQLYTQLKKEAASRVGIDYQVDSFSMRDDLEILKKHLEQLNNDQNITGIIIQKPWTNTWAEVTSNQKSEFRPWWKFLTDQIEQKKDVDGLTSVTLESIKNNSFAEKGNVLPATAKAVLTILDQSPANYFDHKFVILGKSDLLGQPLYYWLSNKGSTVEMLGTKELTDRLASGQALKDADVLISSTGQHNLVTAQMVKDGVIVVDVGEPKGDIDFTSVISKASFITPVPGGVGPMTVISLLENAVDLVDSENKIK